MKCKRSVFFVLAVGTLLAAVCCAGAAFAQQPSRPPKPSPEHQKLQLWFGEWTYEGENQSTFLGPGGKFTGRMTGRPIMDGFGAEYVFVENGPGGEVRTVEIDTYDPVAKNFPYICVSSDGSLYQGSFTMNGNVATWDGTYVAGGKRGWERGTDAVAPDGKSFIKKGEISVDGKTWVPSSSLKATKVKAAQAENASVEQELIKLETELGDAWPKRDAASMDRMLADDYMGTGTDGSVWTKDQILELVKSDERSSAVSDDWKVRVYGDVVVVMGRYTFKMQLEGKEVTGQERFTDTWVKRAGRWQCVAAHASRITQKSAEPPKIKAAESPRSSGVVMVRGTALPYLTEGSGIPCLVTGYSTLYEAVFSDELKKHFQFIFVDWKNSFTADDPFPLAVKITMETLVDDLDEVRRQLGHEKIAILGHSWPGFLPLAYGKKYPSHASHLIIIGCPPYANRITDKTSAEFWEKDASPERKAAHRRNLEASPDSLLNKLGPRERWVMQYVRDRAMCWANPTYDSYWLWLGKGASMDFEHQYYSVLTADYDPTPDFREITTPVFLALGRYDYWAPPKLWDAVKDKLPNLSYHLFQKSGHWPMLEEQELFDRKLIDWLQGAKR